MPACQAKEAERKHEVGAARPPHLTSAWPGKYEPFSWLDYAANVPYPIVLLATCKESGLPVIRGADGPVRGRPGIVGDSGSLPRAGPAKPAWGSCGLMQGSKPRKDGARDVRALAGAWTASSRSPAYWIAVSVAAFHLSSGRTLQP